uniref:uncharacterized protein LOC120835012 isoform X2 n=1 Tax=Gasterosteus aculeatus aculeatus TaxID=481459 RepID=UPI001A97E9D5|nr:uncharacterized protein LOC120835012 isoform X2 [Gasterosteus aculeatus aculeatus]XP_040059405.1 uncharacterized protein LOC120835012 isoform X2 [Gasterosteus aculeatus aculeatus]
MRMKDCLTFCNSMKKSWRDLACHLMQMLYTKDATGTEVDAEIFSDLVGQGNVVLTVFSDQEFSDFSLSSETSDSSFSSSASTIILDVPNKRQRIEDTRDAVSAKQLIEAVLRGKSGGEEVLQKYQTTETLTDAARRQMVNFLVAHMIDNHGHCPTKTIREDYARGIVMLFPSLKDPYSKKGYEHFYDAASSTGYISWRLKTVQRKIRQGSAQPLFHLLPPPPGGLKSPKISACDAVERLVVFHKSCCSLEEHLRNQQGRQPYLLAVGRQKSKIDSLYITMDKRLIPCKANRFLGACDELFKAHFVFNLSYDVALVNFYTFLQTTVYNIDVGKMKESPRVKDLRARLLNQPVAFSPCE